MGLSSVPPSIILSWMAHLFSISSAPACKSLMVPLVYRNPRFSHVVSLIIIIIITQPTIFMPFVFQIITSSKLQTRPMMLHQAWKWEFFISARRLSQPSKRNPMLRLALTTRSPLFKLYSVTYGDPSFAKRTLTPIKKPAIACWSMLGNESGVCQKHTLGMLCKSRP